MSRLSSTHRIVLGLVGLVVSVLLVAGLCGLLPNSELSTQQTRSRFSESAAVSFMALASRMDTTELQATLNRICDRNPDVLSLAVRDATGQLAIECGSHRGLWKSTSAAPSPDECVVPISSNGEVWGQLEVRWTEAAGFRFFGFRVRADIALTGFVAVNLLVCFSIFLHKVLRQINPGKVVPNRVRDALNALSEGLLVLDREHSIVLANDSFTESTGTSADVLIGTTPDQFGFTVVEGREDQELPWNQTSRQGVPVKGVLLTRGQGDTKRTYAVSTVPVRNDKNENRGIVASFEDVTLLQRKQEELRFALSSLKSSTDAVRKQNRELEWLATRDTLTGVSESPQLLSRFRKPLAENADRAFADGGSDGRYRFLQSGQRQIRPRYRR